MHQPIRNNLEEYLKRSRSEVPAELRRHLEECRDCAGELRQLEQQSDLLRSLRAEEAEPRAGFYARVMERIEARREFSVWSVFLQRKFGFRLAVASGMLAALLGVYLVASESARPQLVASPAIAVQNVGLDNAAQQRDAILVDLASFRQ